MALPETMAAYDDCYSLYEAAQADGRGARALLPTYGEALMMRMRLNQARVLERRESARLYERTDHRHGKSENDKFKVTIRESVEGDGWWVYIEVWTLNCITVEGLSDETGTTPQLTGPST